MGRFYYLANQNEQFPRVGVRTSQTWPLRKGVMHTEHIRPINLPATVSSFDQIREIMESYFVV